MDRVTKSEPVKDVHMLYDAQPLAWGRSYLMCPPDYFGVLYEINPWMHRDIQADKEKAYEQWNNLVANIERAGGTVATMEARESVPDLVFAANAGTVDGKRFVVSRFKYPERQPESAYDAEWFEARGYQVIDLPLEPDVAFEGCGDAFALDGGILVGYGFRTDLAAHAEIRKALGVEVFSAHLIDPRFYHLDLSFCPLDSRHAIIAPDAWDPESFKMIQQHVPEPLLLELDEALTFCANSIVVNNTVIMPHCPLRVGRILEKWGFAVCESPITEFLKAGGGVRCLTLALDVSLK